MSNLTPEQKYLIVSAELKARGLKPAVRKKEKQKENWRLGENGFFTSSDGNLYVPTKTQGEFINSDSQFSAFIGARGSGKSLSITTEIPTIDGWKLMGNIEIGDILFDEKGNTSKVTNISPIMYGHKCYRIVFSDDSEVIADAEHLWVTLTAKARSSFGRRAGQTEFSKLRPQCQPKYDYDVFTTEEIKNSLEVSERGDKNHSIDCALPLVLPDKQLLIPPYILGAWLGDGDSNSTRITIGKDSKEIIGEIEKEGGIIISQPHDPICFRIDFVENSQPRNALGMYSRNKDSFHSRLIDLNLLGNKHIPIEYLRASYEQRFALLQGLMDTDGCCMENSKCELSLSNRKLADDFGELIHSLGYKTTLKEGTAKCNGKTFIRYRFSFVSHENIFRISYKLKRICPPKKQFLRTKRRYIVSVEEVDSMPVKCIAVDSPKNLFLITKSFIPTHNTAAGAQKALKKVKEGLSGSVLNPDF